MVRPTQQGGHVINLPFMLRVCLSLVNHHHQQDQKLTAFPKRISSVCLVLINSVTQLLGNLLATCFELDYPLVCILDTFSCGFKMESLKEAVTSTLEKLHIVDTPSTEAQLLEPTDEQVSALKEKYTHEAQDHVFTFWDTLTASQKAQLYAQLSTIDPARVTSISNEVLSPQTTSKPPSLTPVPSSSTASTLEASPSDLRNWRTAGLKAIAANQVAVLLMAGGQGTRLGSSAPKGCYDIGLPSGKSLFQIQAERLLRLQELAKEEFGERGVEVVIPWYIMTSGPTRRDTEEFLRSKKYFGLKVIPLIPCSGRFIERADCRRRMWLFLSRVCCLV
jgi:UTP--glucose-1-phosphate uridylyltransferase